MKSKPQFKLNVTLKLIGYMLLVSLTPLLIFVGSSYDVTRKTIVAIARDYSVHLLGNQRDYLQLQIEQIEILMANIAGNEEIGKLALALNADTGVAGDHATELSTQSKFGYILNGYNNLKGLVSIDLFTLKGHRFHVGDTLNRPDFKDSLRQMLYGKAMESQKSLLWQGVEDNRNTESSNHKVLTAAKIIRHHSAKTGQLEAVGMLVINYSTAYLYEHFSKIDFGDGSYLMVVDQAGRLIYHPDKSTIGLAIEPALQKLIGGVGGVENVRLHEQDVLFNVIALPNTDWRMIGVIPQETLLLPMDRLVRNAGMIMLLCLCLIALISRRFSRSVVAPIKAISDGFKMIQEDRLHQVAALPIKKNDDEIGELVVWFNAFVEAIKARRSYEEKLLQAKIDSDQANKSKSDFLANMSHEIRTPMNAILGMNQLAMASDSEEARNNFLEKANRAGYSLLAVIDNILDLSRIEAGKLQIEHAPLHLEVIVSDLVDVFTSAAHAKNLELLFYLAPDVPAELMGDPLRLRQVLQHLIDNAIKFTGSGEILVKVEKLLEENNDVLCRFSVRDTGIGISPEQEQNLFQQFSQADTSTTRRYGGSGLGLAISKQLVELMGGSIALESEVGAGSRFYFTTPLGKGDASRIAPTLSLPANLRILVVDDNASARANLMRQLATLGCQAVAAASGQEAIDLLFSKRSAQPDFELLIVDYRMPQMDGCQAIQAIRRRYTAQALPIVIMSALDDHPALAEFGRQADGLVYLNKPVLPLALQEAILRASRHERDIGAAQPVGQSGSRFDIDPVLTGARILLVEDNLLNQELAMEILRKGGMKVDVAEHGGRALELVAKKTYDAVLMDCQMPVMDGYEATRQIRADPRNRHLPIIAMTAHALLGERDKTLAAGMDEHLTKPINIGLLYATLAQWIKRAAAHEEMPKADHPADVAEMVDSAEAGASAPSVQDVLDAFAAQDRLNELAADHFNIQFAIKSLGDNEALFRRMCIMFTIEGEKFLASFRDMLAAELDQDAKKRSSTRVAHTLKSSAGIVGALRLQQYVNLLEANCREGQQADILTAFGDVEIELPLVLESIRNYLS